MSLAEATPETMERVFAVAWGNAAARTWNRHRPVLRSFTEWASGPGWVAGDLAGLLDYRPAARDRTRAMTRQAIEAL